MKDMATLCWILKKITGRLPRLLCLILANAGSAAFSVLFALGSREVIDTAVAGEGQAFLRACIVQMGIICGLLLCMALTRIWSDFLYTELDRDFKQKLLGSLLRADYAKAAHYHSGELINRLNNDVRQLVDGVVGIVPNLISMAVRLASAVWVLTTIAPKLTLLLIAVGIMVVLCTGMLRRMLKQRQREANEAEGKVLSFLQEAVERLLVIRSMGLDREVERRAEARLDERTCVQRRRRRISVVAHTAVSVFYRAASFLALVWCATSLMRGAMSFGTLTVVTQLVSQFQTPLVGISGILPRYIAMCTAGERLLELEKMESQKAPVDEAIINLAAKGGYLVAEELSFCYEGDEEPVLSNVSFRLPLGTFTAITGASGIGKSTLLKLMLGVFHPSAGSLYLELDGKRFELNSTGNGLFAYVPQGNLLFSGTLRENILFTRPEATQDELEHAIRVSGMDLFLAQTPDGLNTILGENGEGLSEGQAQRLAIARAVISGAPILLLDEATSALDAQTEQAVLTRLAELPNCTCIAVTHRPAALETADQQLEFDARTVTLL